MTATRVMVWATVVCKYGIMPHEKCYQPKVPRTERELPIRGANYCVYEWGAPEAPPLIYLHGWGDTGSTFQFVVDALGENWRVLAPDWRGFGRSSCNCSSYWFPDYLADLHQLLDIFSPADPVRLIGHSMGGNVASLYAGTFPERIAAFINIEGFGLADSNPADAPQRYRAWIEGAIGGPGFSNYPDIGALARRIRKRHPGMSQQACAFVAREWAVEGADGVTRLRADPLHKLPNPILYRRAEALACSREVTAETLLIIGSNSSIAKEAGALPAAVDLYPNGRRVLIDGAGHMLHFEAPHALARAIEDFLQATL